MLKNDKRIHIYYPDLLRILASLAVIAIHITADTVTNMSFFKTPTWWISITVNSFSRWCVPIFFMISGIFLINVNKSSNIKEFLKKRLNKILLPFFIWSSIYIFYLNRHNLTIVSIKMVLLGFLEGHSASHLWFLYKLLGLYLIAPVIAYFIHNTNKKYIDYYLLLCLVNSFLSPYIEKLFNINLNLYIPLTDIYIFYFISGYYLHNNLFNIKKLYLLYITGICCAIFTIVATFISSSHMHSFDAYYIGYNSPTVLITSIAMFLFIKNSSINKFISKPNIVPIISKLSEASFGVYLIHIMILYTLKDILIGFYHIKVIYFVLLAIPTVFILSYMSILIIRKIPILRKFLT